MEVRSQQMTKRSWERDKSKSLGRKGKTLKDED